MFLHIPYHPVRLPYDMILVCHNICIRKIVVYRISELHEYINSKKPKKNGVPGWTRTNDPLVNSQML